VSYELVLDAHSSPVILEFHTDELSVQGTTNDYGDEVNAPRIAGTDLLITVTIMGQVVDWTLVRNVCLSVTGLWPTVPHSDVSGFDTELDQLT
jgi:hypothetical protein